MYWLIGLSMGIEIQARSLTTRVTSERFKSIAFSLDIR
jgi:hypothetical protein